jgi:biopolymer transport protein ExbB
MSIHKTGWLGLFVLSLSASSVSAQATELDVAYKREFAFLEAERNTLQARLGTVEREEQQKMQAARNEINQLQGKATSLALEADKLQDSLSDVEEQTAAQAETSDVLQSTLQQAEIALSKGGFKLPPMPAEPTAEQRAQQLDAAFAQSIELLKRYGTVREEPGEFFTPNGKKVSGKIFHIGQVAAYGVSDTAAGALAPAGEERLKIWTEGNSEKTARALAAGEQPAQLDIFLFESLEKEVEKRKEKTFEDLMKAGGPIGWIIVVLGVIATLMALARTAILARAASNSDKLVGNITPLLKRGEIAAATELARSSRTPAGRVLEVTLKNLHRPREQLEDMVSEAVMREQPTLDRFGSMIVIAAAVGPLLGLLGTVTGMIATFDVITEFGNSNPKLLAGGISEALVTTEFGLMVAIPMLLIGNLLSGWSQRIKDDIDGAALRVSNIASGNDVVEMERGSRVDSAVPPQLAPAE